jgi:DNA-binding beta-propeller fold protein YncE
MSTRVRPALPAFSALAVTAFVLAGCGAAPRSAQSLPAAAGRLPTPPGPVVHVQSSAGITTIGATGGRWIAPGGTASADWSTVFVVQDGRLRTLDGTSGAERAVQPIRADLRPIVSSAEGRFVALTDSPVRVGEGLIPPGRVRSTVVVAPADPLDGRVRTMSLDGNIVPEGFSPDNTRLYVIDFVPPAHPDRYRVRSLDLATGQIGPVFTFDKTIDTELMQGLSRTQVFSPNGALGPMLYTLYSRAGGPAGYSGRAELHVLALNSGLVHCTDLPAALDIGPSTGAIGVSPDGQRVYVASSNGLVAEIDTSTSSSTLYPILRTTQLALEPGQRTVAVAADNHTAWVGVGRQLLGLDAAHLYTVSRSTIGEPVEALALDQRGQLFAATPTSIEGVDPSAGTATALIALDTTPVRLAVG